MNKTAWKRWTMVTGAISLILMFASHALSAQPTPKKGGTLKIASRGEPATLNSMMNPSRTVIDFMAPVFNGLVIMDPTQDEVRVEKVVPSLAERWEISPDGRIYTFHLTKGVKFHDGRPFTAKDVKYSLDFFRDPAKTALAPLVSMMDRVEIVDDHTVKVHLKFAHVPFLLYLCYPYCPMLPAHLSEANPKSPDFLVGTGPFKFKKRIPGKAWIYERNPDYFVKGLPYVDGVENYVMKKWSGAVDAFNGGRLHMSGNLRYGTVVGGGLTAVEKIKRYKPEASLRIKPIPVIRGIIFNVAGVKGHEGPWQDVRVRRALQLTADYPGSIIAAQGSLDLALNSGIVPPYVATGLSWEEASKIMGIDKPMEERVAEAKRLMKEAGYPDGFDIAMDTRTSTAYHKAAEFLMQGWRKRLNINIKMNILHNAVYFPKRDAGDFDIIYEGMPGRYGGAPDETLSMFVKGVTSNYGQWAHPEYNKLYDQLSRETDLQKREEMSVRMQKIFLEDVPFLINVSVKEGVAVLPTVHGHVLQTAHTTWACMDRIWLEE